MIEAIVLAGGLGTRLREAVPGLPKVMAPIGGRPFLDLLLRSLQMKGITRVILSLGYKAECITHYLLQNPLGMELAYEIEHTALGTGGAIAAALRHAKSDHVLVFNGDTYLDLDVMALERMWPGDRTPVVVARQVPNTKRFGRLEAAGGRIVRFVGTGIQEPGIINAGCYLLPTDVFSVTPSLPSCFSFEREFLSVRDALSLRLFVTDAKFIDIGVPSDYRRAEAELAELVWSPN